jgi:hypothetical protein
MAGAGETDILSWAGRRTWSMIEAPRRAITAPMAEPAIA